MNKRISTMINLGVLVSSAACLLAKMVQRKKKKSIDFPFDDGVPSSKPLQDETWFSSGFLLRSDLKAALMLLFSTYSDEEIAEYSACVDCTDGDLREYWVDTMAALLDPVIDENWQRCPRLEAYGSHAVDLVGKHGNIFDNPACVLINDQADCIYDSFCAVEHNIQLWLADDGELAVVTMFGFMRGPMVLGYCDLDYVVDEDSVLPWSFRELMTRLYRLIDNGRAW